MNENERGEVCAAREAQEEIGCNVDSLLDPDTWFEQVWLSMFFAVSVCLFKNWTRFWSQQAWPEKFFYRALYDKQINKQNNLLTLLMFPLSDD